MYQILVFSSDIIGVETIEHHNVGALGDHHRQHVKNDSGKSEKKIRNRACQSGKCHTVFGILEITRVDRYRLRPTVSAYQHTERAEKIEVSCGIDGDSAEIVGGAISQFECNKGVCRLVERKRKKDGGNNQQDVDDPLANVTLR